MDFSVAYLNEKSVLKSNINYFFENNLTTDIAYLKEYDLAMHLFKKILIESCFPLIYIITLEMCSYGKKFDAR